MSGPFQRQRASVPHRGATVIQGSFRGGPPVGQALLPVNRLGAQARLQPRAGTMLTGLRRGGQPGSPTQTVQAKGPGVEAFPVDLRPVSGGQPLPAEVQAKMESALGADFSDVRIHVGREAATVGAIAFTWGSNIHFAPGQYNPQTTEGQKLLGHELAHVMQQRAGRVSNPFGSGVAVVRDRALEAEADRLGERAAMMPAALPRQQAAQPKLARRGASVPRFPVRPALQKPGATRAVTLAGSGSARPRSPWSLFPRPSAQRGLIQRYRVGFRVEEGVQKHHPTYKFKLDNQEEQSYDLDPWITRKGTAGYEGVDRSRGFKRLIKRLVKNWDCSGSIINTLVKELLGVEEWGAADISGARESLSGMAPRGQGALIRQLFSLQENIKRREADIPANCYDVQLTTKPRVGDATTETVKIGWTSLLKDARLLLKAQLVTGRACPASMHDVTLLTTAVQNSTDAGVVKLRRLGLLSDEMGLSTQSKREGSNLYTASATGGGSFNFGYGHLRFILFLEWRIVTDLQS